MSALKSLPKNLSRLGKLNRLNPGPGGGDGQPADPNILFFDDFESAPGPLVGREAQVGGWHYPSGPNAANMTVADGLMKQTAADDVGYDNVLLSETPGMVGCDFIWGLGPQPPVMALYPYAGAGDPVFSNKLLHLYMSTMSLDAQMADLSYFGSYNANHPAAWQGPASPFALVVGQKYSLECRVQDKWVFMELFNASGVSIAKAQAYDSLVPSLVGRAGFLAETFDDELAYEAVFARKAVPFTVPVITPAIDSYFPGGLDGLTDSPYAGGSVAWNSPGSVTISANGIFGRGAALPIGPIAVGDTVRVCVDVTSVEAGGFVTTIAPVTPGAPISAIEPLFSAPGRAVANLVATGSDANACLLVGGTDFGTQAANIKGLFILKNGPTSFV